MTIKLQDAEVQFRRFRTGQGMAVNTLKGDAQAFSILYAVMGHQALLEDLNSDRMLELIEYSSLTRKNSSINFLISRWSVFFKWARTFGHSGPDWDPLAGFRIRSVPKNDCTRLSIEQFPMLLDAAENPRDRMLCALGLYLFLRTSEATSLQMKNVNLMEGTITVTVHKTHDADIMPISSELDKELRRWFTWYTKTVGPLEPNYYVVPVRNKGGYALSRGAISPARPMIHTERHIRKALVRMGWPTDEGRIGMHLLRKSGARCFFDELNEQTIDGALKIVQAHLHHASVVMTEKYLGLTVDRVIRDRILKGQPMFPSLSDANVVPIYDRHLRRLQ